MYIRVQLDLPKETLEKYEKLAKESFMSRKKLLEKTVIEFTETTNSSFVTMSELYEKDKTGIYEKEKASEKNYFIQQPKVKKELTFNEHMDKIATLVFSDERQEYIPVIQQAGNLTEKQKQLLIVNLKHSAG